MYATARSASEAECTEGPEVGGSLQGLAEEAAGRGAAGRVVGLRCDHRDDEQVRAVLARIEEEQGGRLDVLVNNAFQVRDGNSSSLLRT